MPTTINNNDKTLCDSLQVSTRSMEATGLLIDTNGDGTGDTPYATQSVPVSVQGKPLDAISPPGSALDQKMADIVRSASAPMVSAMRPVGLSAGNSNPSASFTAATDLLTITLTGGNDKPVVARTFLAVANLSASSSVTNTRFDFWVEVDGAATTVWHFFFNDASVHRNFSGSWVITVPAGASTIKLRAVRGSGTGTLSLDSNDFVALNLLS